MNNSIIPKNLDSNLLSSISKKLVNISARVTPNNRQVIKAYSYDYDIKVSATRYPNGTIVETRTYKPR